MRSDQGDITILLHRWRDGDKEAESEIFERLLPELRKIAARCFRNESSGNSLQPTLLVNEAFLRLAAVKSIEWNDRGHFLAMSARMIRRYLLEHGRARPSVQFLPMASLPESFTGKRTNIELATAIDFLLDDLAKESPQRRAIVELKFVLGMSDIEAAEALNLRLMTFQREWYRARSWLFDQLTEEPCPAQAKTTNA